MAKAKKTVFFCQNCGHEEAKWLGQCPVCKEWNTFVEEKKLPEKGSESGIRRKAEPISLSRIETKGEERIRTEMEELDRVLGGGIVKGSLVLVGGDPGIGKSTLLLQVCRILGEKGEEIIYISGEESARQIKLRADRMGKFDDRLSLLCETNLETIEEVIRTKKPHIAVIDSIQTMYSEEIGSAPGKCVPGAGGNKYPDAPGKGNGHYNLYCRACNQRGDGGRPKGTGTHGGHSVVF